MGKHELFVPTYGVHPRTGALLADLIARLRSLGWLAYNESDPGLGGDMGELGT